MHNDAVVQGLSEIPVMQEVRRWGILTIGTGLGNARFTNHWERLSDQAAQANAGTARRRGEGLG